MKKQNVTSRVTKNVQSILISQPAPEHGKSPFTSLADRYGVQVDFRPFIQVDGVDNKEFRKERIQILDHDAIIFTSRNAIVHFFRICEEMRIIMPSEMKYFCKSEAIALYLQKYIQYRKRKVFFADGKLNSFLDLLQKHQEGMKYFMPISNVDTGVISDFLKKQKIKYSASVLYMTIASDLSDLENIFYDMIVFFSPTGLKSLYENFPDFEQNDTRIAAFGTSTKQAVEDAGLFLDIEAPSPQFPSMAMAIEHYIKSVRKK